MDKNKIIALLLIGLVTTVCVINRGPVGGINVDLLATTVNLSKSVLILASTAVGVVIGTLLK